MKRHVALIGFMAAGKSTVGSKLARALQREFIDTDAAIAAEHGAISELFARRGEAGFRELEFAAAAAALRGEPRVVSLGGGAITYEPTRVLVASAAARVYLQASAATIFKRVRRSPAARPLLGPRPTIERIEQLLEARSPWYLAAEIVVPVDGRTVRAITDEITERLEAAGVTAA